MAGEGWIFFEFIQFSFSILNCILSILGLCQPNMGNWIRDFGILERHSEHLMSVY